MRSPSSRRANPWTDIQTGLRPVVSSRAVLAQDLGDGLSPDLKGMRAARQPRKAAACPVQSRAMLLLPLAQICLSPQLSKTCGMCNGLLKCACDLKHSLWNSYQYHRYANHPGGQHDRSRPASPVQTGLPLHCLGPTCPHLDKASSLQAAQACLWLQSIFLRAAQFKALKIKMK